LNEFIYKEEPGTCSRTKGTKKLTDGVYRTDLSPFSSIFAYGDNGCFDGVVVLWLAPTVPRGISLLSNTRLEGCRLEAGGQRMQFNRKKRIR
jgi:hypothetical protein